LSEEASGIARQGYRGASRRIKRVVRRRRYRALLLLSAGGAVLLTLFVLSSGDSTPVHVISNANTTPNSSEKIGVPRFVSGPMDRARDFAWRHALVLVEVGAVLPRPRGIVIDQFPLPEMLVRAGDALTVTVSLGASGEPLPTDQRVAARVPLRLTPIGMATVAVRQTAAARRNATQAVGRTATAAHRAADGTTGAVDAAATRRARSTGAALGATRTVSPTLTPTGTLPAPAVIATPTGPTPTATRERSGPPPEPEGTKPPPAPPQPPTPPPPPPEAPLSLVPSLGPEYQLDRRTLEAIALAKLVLDESLEAEVHQLDVVDEEHERRWRHTGLGGVA